jgi:hypothetical protein
MKNAFCLLFMPILLSGCFSSKVGGSSYSTKLVGSWSYIETRDSQGKKIEYDDSVKTLINEPRLVYKTNFIYRKIFTPENSDTGKWKFNIKTMTIEHHLFIDSTDFVGKDLIRQGLAIKQKDGKYYEEDNMN